jgi:hypothetical protein
MLTIIILTEARYSYVLPLLNDILASKTDIKIWIVDYKSKNSKNLDKLLKKKKIKLIFDKKTKTFGDRFIKYLARVKTRYAWFIGDDDRIETNCLNNLLRFLKLNNSSGFTINHHSFSNNNEIIKNKKINNKIITKSIYLEKDISEIGMLSTQIINSSNYRKISKSLDKKILTKYGYPQVYIILQLIKKFNDWKLILNKIVYYRCGNFNFTTRYITERISGELNGYTQPAKKIYGFNSSIYRSIFKRIFYLHITDWVGTASKIIKKERIKKIFENNIYLFPNFWHIKVTLFIIYKFPLKITFYILKIIRKINYSIC